jgi:LAS superfamily LD-carboxypeptidase LdcB
MYDVSKTAEGSSKRKDELVNKFVSGNNDYKNLKVFYPWPTYINKDDGIEEYLGKAGFLDNPNNVDEIRFIEDLFRAFFLANEAEKNFDALIKENNTNWYSVNPLDTSLYNDISPYKREEPKKPKDIADMVMIRAMIFLAFSNRNNLTDDEITNFAVKEAESILNGAQNSKLIDGFANTYCLSGTSASASALINVTGNINNVDKKVIEQNGTNYYYNYIGDTGYIDKPTSEFKKIFPIKKGFFDADWTDITKQIDDGNLLLSNYQTAVSLTNPKYKFERDPGNLANSDGGTYIKLIDPTFFNSKASNPLVSPSPNTDITMNLEELKNFVPNMAAAGYNVFGGAYGVQQYTSLKYGVPEIDDDGGLPFRFVFIADSGILDVKAGGPPVLVSKSNGFALTIGTSNINDTPKNKSIFIDIAESVWYDTNKNHKEYGNNRVLIKEYIKGNTNVTYPYVNFQIAYDDKISGSPNSFNMAAISLFGSRLYYEQKTQEAKAFLFLHSIPWNGLANSKPQTKTYDPRGVTIVTSGDDDTLFNSSETFGFEILNIFNKRAGFISTPKLWPAFIGGLIWRYESEPDPIIFYNDDAEAGFKSLIPTFSDKDAKDVDYIPKKSDYLTRRKPKLSKNDINNVMSFSNKYKISDNYKMVDKVILTLPEQAKDEFKKAFFDFVNGDFQTLRGACEIYDGNTWLGWKNLYDSVMSTSGALYGLSGGRMRIKEDILKSNYKNVDNYSTFSPILIPDGTPSPTFKYGIFLEFKDGSPAANLIMKLLTDETYIVNTSPNIWDYIVNKDKEVNQNQNPRKNIEVSEVTLNKYLEKFISAMNPTGLKSTNDEQKKQAEQNLFGTTDENVIKFMLYKSCKNIYDKWIGNVDNDNIMFQCGGRGPVDTELAKKRGVSEPKLIDSFRFVTRSFTDIGDKLAINPLPVVDFLKNNSNTSFYAAVTSLLSSNNFDFIALPNFINFNNPDKLEQVFEPYDFREPVDGCGPSFVCVYLGERSKNLDFDSDSYNSYINDGFDIECDENSGLKPLPIDFVGTQQGGTQQGGTQQSIRQQGDEPVSVFNVTFGQQNQNIFKDITLDQSEFGETAESLKIMDDISNNGFETKNTLGGQNIYNVYSVRSYKVEIEMMGDAMIQPMMYFQLNNIPMFHGAYMITHVKHSIKPNHMSTKFTGVRIRKPETKIFDLGELYMSMLDTMNVLQSNSSTANKSFGQRVSGSFPPIVRTIIENGGVNGNIESTNIKLVPVDEITGVKNEVVADRKKMLAEAVPALTEMLKDFVTFAKANKYPDIGGNYICITSLYRSLEYQKKLYDENIAKGGEKGAVAYPGTSNHSWGIALDFQFLPQKNGASFLKVGNWSPVSTKAAKEGFDLTINPSLKWLLDNGWKYGFISPKDLRDQTGVEEYWHFEYHGRAAYCLYSKFPSTYGYTPDSLTGKDIKNPTQILNFNYKPVVKNPKDKNNNIADYAGNDCDYKTVESGDGADNKATISSDTTIIKNQTEVKNYFKAKGLTQTQVAGIMGNIQKESLFNPLAENKADVNGFPSVGLIQWNGKYTPKGGSKDANTIFSLIGRTVNQQLDYLTTKFPDYDEWLKLGGGLSAYSSAYEFARLVEKCVGCIDGEQVYKTNQFNPSDRSEYANDFYRRFSLKGDYLFW